MGKFNPVKIILFGSYARGTSNRDNDIDLMVIMPDGTDIRATGTKIFEAVCYSPIEHMRNIGEISFSPKIHA